MSNDPKVKGTMASETMSFEGSGEIFTQKATGLGLIKRGTATLVVCKKNFLNHLCDLGIIKELVQLSGSTGECPFSYK
jgi:hypothetical protein